MTSSAHGGTFILTQIRTWNTCQLLLSCPLQILEFHHQAIAGYHIVPTLLHCNYCPLLRPPSWLMPLQLPPLLPSTATTCLPLVSTLALDYLHHLRTQTSLLLEMTCKDDPSIPMRHWVSRYLIFSRIAVRFEGQITNIWWEGGGCSRRRGEYFMRKFPAWKITTYRI